MTFWSRASLDHLFHRRETILFKLKYLRSFLQQPGCTLTDILPENKVGVSHVYFQIYLSFNTVRGNTLHSDVGYICFVSKSILSLVFSFSLGPRDRGGARVVQDLKRHFQAVPV